MCVCSICACTPRLGMASFFATQSWLRRRPPEFRRRCPALSDASQRAQWSLRWVSDKVRCCFGRDRSNPQNSEKNGDVTMRKLRKSRSTMLISSDFAI